MEEMNFTIPTPSGPCEITQLKQADSKKLAILLPGANYTCDRPILYYAAEILFSRGFDVCLVNLLLGRTAGFRAASTETKLNIAETIYLGIYDQLIGGYSEILLIGKSLGSHAASFIASNRSVDALALLTPISAHSLQTHRDLKPFVVIGDKDPRFPELRDRFIPTTLIIPDADHSLERGSALGSIEALRIFVTRFEAWLNEKSSET